MTKSLLVLASAGTLMLGVPLTGVSGSSTVRAGAQGRLQQWMRSVSLHVAVSGSARINVMLRAAIEDAKSSLTAMGRNQRGMAYQEAAAMANAMLAAETWWHEDHISLSSSDAATLKASLVSLATVKSQLIGKGWWTSRSQLAHAMTSAALNGSALLVFTNSAKTRATGSRGSVRGTLYPTIVTHTTVNQNNDDKDHSTAPRRTVMTGSSAAKTPPSSSSQISAKKFTVRSHSRVQANLGMSGQITSQQEPSPATFSPQIQSNASLTANVHAMVQLGL